MGLKKEIFLYGDKVGKETKVVDLQDDFLPLPGKRSTIPDAVNSFAPLSKLVEIPPDFSLEYLSTLEHLAAYNDYVSYALDNVVQLANTEHDIYFPDDIPEKEQNEMRLLLRTDEENWYANSGGVGSLKADLLAQIVINGALSSEIIPDKRILDTRYGIEKIVRLAPKYVLFFYNKSTDNYEPYQRANLMRSGKDATGYKKLNTKTYKYIAMRRYFQTPYAIPPFISAIDSLCTAKGMDESFKNVMQKLGMLGFLSAEVVPPNKKPGESPEAYQRRAMDYLANTVAPQIEQNLSKGFTAGYIDKHKFTLQGNNMNVQGAEGLARIINQRIFAGVKQDPNMLGHNEATTETFGRVIMAKMLSQTRDYQRVVDRFFEQAYMMHLWLKGYTPDYVTVESQKPLVSDKVKEQEAEGKKIDNVLKKVERGLIDPDTGARELDYDEAADPDRMLSGGDNLEESTTTPDNRTDPSGGGDNDVTTEENRSIARYLAHKYGRVPTYPYDLVSEECCSVTRTNFVDVSDFHDKKMEKFIRRYFNAIYGTHKKASKTIATKLSERLSNMRADTPLETVQNSAYIELIALWNSEFIAKVSPTVRDNVTRIWEYFRKDTKIFGANVSVSSNKKRYSRTKKGESFETIVPEGVLDLDDFRAITYLESSDILYLGKYITDPDVKNRVYKYIADNYVEGHLPIGNNEDAIKRFVSTFSEEVNLTGWKIRRIIDTTVNKVRNYSHVYYLDQAGIDRYEIIEVLDNLTCEWCEHMDGKTFSVSTTKDKITKEVSAGAGNVGSVSPFLTGVKIEDVQKMSASELQSAGYDVPPYHPHCRGTHAAVFDDE